MRFLILLSVSAICISSSHAEQKSSSDEQIRREKIMNLSEEDRNILRDGELPTWRYVTGGVLSIYPGFGIGHAVQGVWLDRGWMFTLAQAGFGALAVAEAFSCGLSSMVQDECEYGPTSGIGLVGFMVAYVWGAVDAWAYIPRRNRRYRELKSVYGEYPEISLVPQKDGGTLNLVWSF